MKDLGFLCDTWLPENALLTCWSATRSTRSAGGNHAFQRADVRRTVDTAKPSANARKTMAELERRGIHAEARDGWRSQGPTRQAQTTVPIRRNNRRASPSALCTTVRVWDSDDRHAAIARASPLASREPGNRSASRSTASLEREGLIRCPVASRNEDAGPRSKRKMTRDKPTAIERARPTHRGHEPAQDRRAVAEGASSRPLRRGGTQRASLTYSVSPSPRPPRPSLPRCNTRASTNQQVPDIVAQPPCRRASPANTGSFSPTWRLKPRLQDCMASSTRMKDGGTGESA